MWPNNPHSSIYLCPQTNFISALVLSRDLLPVYFCRALTNRGQSHIRCHCDRGPAQSVCTAASVCSYLSTPASSSNPGQAVGFRPVHHQSPRGPMSSASAAARSKSDCPRFRDGTMFKLGLRVAMLTCEAYSGAGLTVGAIPSLLPAVGGSWQVSRSKSAIGGPPAGTGP